MWQPRVGDRVRVDLGNGAARYGTVVGTATAAHPCPPLYRVRVSGGPASAADWLAPLTALSPADDADPPHAALPPA